MANSIHSGYIRTPATHADQNYPVNTSMMRDGIINNVAHVADESAQPLVKFVLETGVTLSNETDADDQYQRIESFGPFIGRVRKDGSSYRYRIRVRGFNSAANSLTVKVAVHTRATTWSAPESALFSGQVSATTSSTTDAWLSTSPSVTGLNREAVLAASEQWAVLSIAGGSSYVNVEVFPVFVSVFFTGTAGTYFALTGLDVSEYVGT